MNDSATPPTDTRVSRSARIATAIAAACLLFATAVVMPSGTVAAHWRDGMSPNGCSSSQTVRSATLGYGPGDSYVMGRVQVRFSDPCDIIWTRVCIGIVTTDGRVSVRLATRGAGPAGAGGTYTDNGRAGTDSSQPACGSNSYEYAEWTYGAFTDCTEDFGAPCPSWGEGSMDAKVSGTYYYDYASTSGNKF